MKKLTLAFCLLVGGIFAANAQDTTSVDKQQQQYPTQGAQSTEQDNREKINSRDLPDAVKRSLEGTEYRGWLINSAYKMNGTSVGDANQDSASTQSDSTAVSKPETEGMVGEVFVVELKNGAQTKTVRFDKDGKSLDDPNQDNDDQR